MNIKLSIVVLLIAGLSVWFFIGKNNTTASIPAGHILPPKNVKPYLKLQRDDKQTINLSSAYPNKWLALYFGYTNCPDICPIDLAIMAGAWKQMNHPKPQVAFISIDAKRDLGNLSNYAQKFNPNFIGLTATGANLERLTKALGVYYEYEQIKKNSQMADHSHHQHQQQKINHTGSFAIINPNGEYVAILTKPHQVKPIASSLNRLIN